MIKKIKIAMCALIAFFTIIPLKISALETFEATDGESYATFGSPCSEDGEGCASWLENFEIRATLVDQNKRRIDGTKTIEFYPINPYNNDDYIKSDDVTDHGSGGYSATETLNQYYEEDYSFVGSNVAKITGEDRATEVIDTSNERYGIFLGFGERNYAQDDFEAYSANRNAFISYASNLKARKINVSGFGKVSFVDFFLKVCGFSDVWNSSQDITTLTKIGTAQKNGTKFYILIEPVYSYGVQKNYVNHQVRGTTKQLAQFLVNNKDQANWFYTPFLTDLAANYYCNFIDRSGALGLNSNDSYLCSDYSNFEFIKTVERVIERFEALVDRVQTSVVCVFPKSKKCQDVINSVNESKRRFETRYESTSALSLTKISGIYGKLADPNSSVGVNIIDLSQILKSQSISYTNKCTLNINSCMNNNFIFSSKLSSNTDMFSCVYPSNTNATPSNTLKNNYAYQVDDDLWCYDDVKYDFGELTRYYYNGRKNKNILDKNQLAEIPSGKLTVNRTCFSKNDISSGVNSALNTAFETDNSNYQKKFTLSFSGTDYIYERGEKYQLTNGAEVKNNFSYDKEEKESQSGEKYYEYSSTFFYDYTLKSGYSSTSSCVNISDYNITNTLGNSNCIDLDGMKKSKTIIIPSSTEEGIYTNFLSTDSKNITPELNNAYGYANKMYNTLNSNMHTVASSELYKTDASSTQQYKNNSDFINITNSYTLVKKYGEACFFETEVKDKNILEEGVQFRVISLTNPFPARDGTSRLAGTNWLNDTENNVKDYIQNNRGVLTEAVYEKEPMYKITLDAPTMIKIREYNKNNSYTNMNLTCEEGTGRMCISSFLRNELSNLEGTCATEKASNIAQITKINERIDALSNLCRNPAQCLNSNKDEIKELDKNGDGIVTTDDRLTIEYYTCADKTAASGG